MFISTYFVAVCNKGALEKSARGAGLGHVEAEQYAVRYLSKSHVATNGSTYCGRVYEVRRVYNSSENAISENAVKL